MARKSDTMVEEEPPKTHASKPPHSQPSAQTTGNGGSNTPAPASDQTATAAANLAPVQPAPLAAPLPPALGKTPTAINQMIVATGTKATHFTGPVVSGPPAGRAATGGVQGTAVLVLDLQLDYSMGNFSLPIQFPPNAIVIWAAGVQYQAFNTAEPSFSLGRTSGAADIVAATALAAAPDKTTVVDATGAVPFPFETGTGIAPGQAFLSITGNTGNTAGGAFLLIAYVVPARPWN